MIKITLRAERKRDLIRIIDELRKSLGDRLTITHPPFSETWLSGVVWLAYGEID